MPNNVSLRCLRQRRAAIGVDSMLLLWTLAFHCVAADVTLFACQRLGETAEGDADELFGGTCGASVEKGIDYSQLGAEIVDGSTSLAESDAECCERCRETPGCRSWTRFVEDGGEGRPENGCWLSGAQSEEQALTQESAHSGLVPPLVPSPQGCDSWDGFGFDGVPYNDPELLIVTNTDECCLHCQADAPCAYHPLSVRSLSGYIVCKAWVFDDNDRSCSLFFEPRFRQPCQSCIGGRISIEGTRPSDDAREIILASCSGSDRSGNEKTQLSGTPISKRGSFRNTLSSTDCCEMCAMIRECKSWSWEERRDFCTLFGDIPTTTEVGEGRDSSGVVAPKVCDAEEFDVREGVELVSASSQNQRQGFIASDAEECGLRCLEIPSCRAWTFAESGDCSVVNQADVDIQRCPDCSSALVESRYATEEDKALLQEIDERIADVESSSPAPPAPSRPSTPSRPPPPSDPESTTEPDPGGQPSEPDETKERSTGTDTPPASSPKEDEGSDSGWYLPWLFVLASCVIFLLIFFPACFQYRKYRRDKTIREARSKIASSHNLTQGLEPQQYGDGPSGEFESQAMTRSDPDYQESTAVPIWRGQFESDPSLREQRIDLSPQQMQFLKEVLEDSTEMSSFFQFRSSSSLRLRESALDSVLQLEPGQVIANKYEIESGTKFGQNNAIVNARVKFGQAMPVVLKFFKSKEEFERESSFYANSVSSNFLPDVLDIYDGVNNEALGLPPLCGIVLERGDMSLEEWLSKQTSAMDPMDQRNVLYKISRGVQFLHDSRVVHRDLKPGNIVVFSASLFALKLIDLGSACRRGDPAPIEYTLRYAPPEVVTAHLQKAPEIIAHPAADMWCLGLIFWEVLVGEAMFGSKYSQEQVLAMLAGIQPLPFEARPEMWNQIPSRAARRLVQALLHRHPDARWPIQKVLANGFFSTGHDTVAHEEQIEAFGNKLQEIAEGVTQIQKGMITLQEISLENLKLNASQALIACISFYEIDPSETAKERVSGAYLMERYQNHQLNCVEAPLEPNYNLFVQRNDEPTALLRIGRQHLVRVSLMTAGDFKVEVPIDQILWIKFWPTELEPDLQESQFVVIKNEGHCIDGIGYWNTTGHRDLSLQLLGRTSVDVTIGFRLKGQQQITVIQKTVLMRMNSENSKFRALRAFNRTKAFYSNLPQWAKIYIHGSVVIARLLMN